MTRIVIATKFGFDIDPQDRRAPWRPQQPARTHQGGLRKPRSNASRRMSSTCSINTALIPPCDRGCGRSGQGADRRREGQAFWAFRTGRRNDPARSCSPAGDGGPERILAVVSGAGSGGSAIAGAPRHRVCLLQSARVGFLTGTIDTKTTFDTSDFRSGVARFAPEAREANMALVDLVRAIASRKKATPAQIALSWAVGTKAVDRANAGHQEAQSS